MFYLNGKKIVPLNIYSHLTAIGLAYWIMDDGSKSGKGLHLNTYSFNQESIDRLLYVLQYKFELECSIHIHSKGSRIFIPSKSMPRLRDLVNPYIFPSMLYK